MQNLGHKKAHGAKQSMARYWVGQKVYSDFLQEAKAKSKQTIWPTQYLP